MSSTQNINTPGNYLLEQKQYKDNENYTLYPNSQYGAAFNTRLPGNGVNPGQIPWDQLSHNAVQIESFLFGVNSTNLVNLHQPILVPKLKMLDTANFFEKTPTLIPEPLTVEKGQRPFPCP
jgi:hypothetical protein